MELDSTSPRPLRLLQKVSAVAILRLRNRMSRKSVLGKIPVTLSITSYGDRLHIVAHAIESLARSRHRPRRFILWISEASFDLDDYPMLQRLVDRGLEIRYTKDYGPHKKVYPFVALTKGNEGPLVIADDDIIYDRLWLAHLYAGFLQFPHHFVGMRGHRIELDGDGRLAPYANWLPVLDGASPSYLNFLTGGAGVVLSPTHLRKLDEMGDKFMELCPRADDIWINVAACRAGLRGHVIATRDVSCLMYPRSQKNALSNENTTGGGNDVQLNATLSLNDLTRMAGELDRN